MRRCYIAGPMTGIEAFNFPAFHAEAARLRALGYHVENPAEINAGPVTDWTVCMRKAVAQLVTCDTICLLPGWSRSRGARIEYGLAVNLGMEILEAGRG